MTAENYRKHLENLKSLGRTEVRPFKDEDRAVIWDEVFGEVKKEEPKEKIKKSK